MTHEFNSDKPFWLSVAYKYTKDKKESEELVQEAIVRYLHKKDEEIENPKAYITTTIRHLHVNTKRRQKAHVVYSKALLQYADSEHYIDDRVETENEVNKWLKVLAAVLTPAERAVFILKTAFDYDYQSIQDFFGLSYENSRQLLFRARTKVLKYGENILYSETETPLVRAFAKASKHGDVEELISLLKQEMQGGLPLRA